MGVNLEITYEKWLSYRPTISRPSVAAIKAGAGKVAKLFRRGPGYDVVSILSPLPRGTVHYDDSAA